MAWPTGNVSLANVDADSDSISSARADIYSAFTKLNEIITNGPGSGNVTVYNDDNVAAYLPTHTGNVSGNVFTTTGGIFWANGTAYSTGGGGGSTYGNVDVAAYLPTYTGNISAGNVTVTGNVYSAGGGPLITGRVTPTANTAVLGTAVSLGSTATDIMSFTLPSAGTWQINYVVRGRLPDSNQERATTVWISDNSDNAVTNSQLTICKDTQTNSYSGSPYWDNTATGVITVTTSGSATYKLRGSSSYAAGSIQSDSTGYTYVTYIQLDSPFSINSVAYTANLSTAGNITASGNVTGTYFIGDGSKLTNLPGGGSYGNTQVAAYLASSTFTGTIGSGSSGRTQIFTGDDYNASYWQWSVGSGGSIYVGTERGRAGFTDDGFTLGSLTSNPGSGNITVTDNPNQTNHFVVQRLSEFTQNTKFANVDITNQPTGTPSNTSSPAGYMEIVINGTTRYVPYYE